MSPRDQFRMSLDNYRRAGHGLSLTQEITFLDAPGREVSSQEIETQKLHGFRAGEVVKILWALICSRPDIASWDSAIWVVEDAWAGEGHKSGPVDVPGRPQRNAPRTASVGRIGVAALSTPRRSAMKDWMT
jgi:hypothetical protein